MFILTTLKDNVRVSPMDFQFPRPTAVESELNKKYSNRVLHGVGLCVRVFDILSLTDGIVHSCTSGGGSDSSSTSGGAYMTKVFFRMVVFRPFIGEVLVGKIASSSPNGIRVTLQFFDDIVIPAEWMKENSLFNSEEGAWVWQVKEDPESTEVTAELFMDKDDSIRFRVENENFVDVGPMRFGASGAGITSMMTTEGSHESLTGEPSNSAPYTLTCSIVEPGLGCCSWWDN